MPDKDKQDLQRYRDLLQSALRSVDLTENEAGLLHEALQQTLIDASTARNLGRDLLLAVRHTQLDDKWNVSMPNLIAKLSGYNDLQRMAIVDALEKAWELPMYVTDSLYATGLLVRPVSNGYHTGSEADTILQQWILRVNAERAPELRALALPPTALLICREYIEPSLLVTCAEKSVFWDNQSRQWSIADWLALAKQWPLLPSQVLRRLQADAPKAAIELEQELKKMQILFVTQKASYLLPNNIRLTARWDGNDQWWFDIANDNERVVTVENNTGILYAELRAELGMGSMRLWQGGLYTFWDLCPHPNNSSTG